MSMIVACVLLIMWTISSRVLVPNGFHVPVGIGSTKTVSKTKSSMQVGVNGFVLSVCANGSYHIVCS